MQTSNPLSACLNQSINIYIAPLQDTYSEALPTQAKRKRTVFRRWWNWEQAPFGRCLGSTGSPFQVFGPTTENERVCITAERGMGLPNYREQRNGVYDDLHMKRESGRARADRRAPSQTSTATPRTQSCKRCAVEMEASATHPAYSGTCGHIVGYVDEYYINRTWINARSSS